MEIDRSRRTVVNHPRHHVEPDNAALICPECDYNLTGLTENRCPECGIDFDPELLRELQSDVPTRSTPWDREGGLVGFARTWWLAAFRPGRFAAGLASRSIPRSATSYSWLCYAAAASIVWGTSLFFGAAIDSEFALFLASVTICEFAGAALCEVVTAALLTLIIKPTRAQRGYRFWRGMTHYTSGFLVLTAVCGTGGVLLDRYVSSGVIWLGILMIYLWWAAALGAMIARRSDPGPAQWIARAVAPVIGLVSAFLVSTAYVMALVSIMGR